MPSRLNRMRRWPERYGLRKLVYPAVWPREVIEKAKEEAFESPTASVMNKATDEVEDATDMMSPTENPDGE